MLIRTVEGSDMNQIISLWQEALPYISINRKIFMNKVFLEANFDKNGFFVAVKNDKIVGFVYTITRQVPICANAPMETQIGWINGFIIDKNYIYVGEKLLETAENHLASSGKSIIKTGYYW